MDIPIHLDLHSEDVEERSQKIGPFEEFWTVMKDPDGNGFCVS
jgi:hypothetical protein